jgi:hypothetical protein
MLEKIESNVGEGVQTLTDMGIVGSGCRITNASKR